MIPFTPVVPPPPPHVPAVEVRALPDGTPAWFVPRDEVPLVRVELSLRHDGTVPPGALAALGARWGEGTEAHPGRSWRAALDGLGAETSVGCGTWRCWLDVEVPTDTLEPALALVAEALRAPELDGIGRLRRAWRAEWKTDPRAPDLVPELALDRALFPDGHPWRQDRSPAFFRGVRPGAVRAVWADVLAGARASLVVVGDVDPDAALPMLAGAYGTFPGKAPPSDPAPPRSGPRGVLVDVPGEAAARVLVALPGPPRDASDAGAWALAVHVLGGDFAGRLNTRLREELGWTYAARATHQDAPDFGLATIRATVPGERAAAALAEIGRLLDAAAAGGFREEEVAAARHTFFAEAAGSALTLRGLAAPLGHEQIGDLPPGETVRRVARLADVSVADVNAAARRWLAEPRTWVVSGDRNELEPLLEEAGLVPDTVWSACTAVWGRGCR